MAGIKRFLRREGENTFQDIGTITLEFELAITIIAVRYKKKLLRPPNKPNAVNKTGNGRTNSML
jgi:hypothetical protein